MVEEAPREAHIPAQQPPPGQEARLPRSDGHEGRSQRPARSSAQGPQAPVGLIWRLHDRRTFIELRRRGRRTRSGSVAVTVMLDPVSPTPLPPRIAFAVPRKVGPAVVRNRLRRQVRAHLASRRADHRLPSGDWLFAIQPGAADLERSALLEAVDTCVDRMSEQVR